MRTTRRKPPTPEVVRSILMQAIGRSKGSLELIGEGDWTPQDSIHVSLIDAIEAFLATEGKG